MATSFLTSGPPYPDLFLEDGTCGRSYNGNETELKYNLLSKTWDDVHIFKFTARYAQGRFRTLQPKYLVSYPWLRYSLASDGVYCAQCHLFAGPDNRVKTLVRTVLRDWSNISKIVVSHSKSASHLSNCEAADNFLAVMKGDKKDICCNMSSQYNAVVEKNRNILVSIVEAIIFLGKQNIAIRGHEEEKGNFRALLNFQAKHDPILKEHLEKGDARSMYLSPDIQNELISICGNQITEHIVSECNRAPCFGFMADEATDASTMEQMALCLRYYDGAELREDFILFAECKSTTGESLAEAFLTNLEQANVNVDKMRGQGYDGAANMAGIHRGVQARIKNRIPGAVYTHCKAHSLNLAIIHASSEMYARNMMGTVQQIAFAFNYSAKRLLRFQENLDNDEAARVQMERRTKLQSLCETRWAARADALHTFLCSFRVVVASLDELANDYRDTKAAGYSRSIQNFEFILTLVAVEDALSKLVNLSKLLQKKTCDLLEASEEAQVVITMLESDRNDHVVWNRLYEKAVSLAEAIGVEPSVPRRPGRQANRPNAPADTPSQYWKVNMFLPFLDHLVVELNTRLIKPHGRFTAQFLLPTKSAELTPARAAEIFAEYRPDLECDQETFLRECQRWKAK